MKNDQWAEVIVAALIKRLGGKVTLTHAELMDAESSTLYMEYDVSTSGRSFIVEDNSVIQGVTVDLVKWDV
jgi:hypothetical protein